MNDSVGESKCPFCNKSNLCMAAQSEQCWCMRTRVPAQLIKLVPEELKGKNCICEECVRLFNADPRQFSETHLGK